VFGAAVMGKEGVFLKYGCQWSLCGIENQGAAVSERAFF